MTSQIPATVVGGLFLLLAAMGVSYQDQAETKEALLELFGEPAEAEVVEEKKDGTALIRAKPRFQLEQAKGSWVNSAGEDAPAPIKWYLRLKVKGRSCRQYWSFRSPRGRLQLDHKKEYIFLLKSPKVVGSSCNILRVWDGEELVFDSTK